MYNELTPCQQKELNPWPSDFQSDALPLSYVSIKYTST